MNNITFFGVFFRPEMWCKDLLFVIYFTIYDRSSAENIIRILDHFRGDRCQISEIIQGKKSDVCVLQKGGSFAALGAPGPQCLRFYSVELCRSISHIFITIVISIFVFLQESS